MKMTKKTYETHPAGTFVAAIAGIYEDDSQYGPIFKVRFQTEEGEVTGRTSQTLSDKSKFGKIVCAVLGAIPDDLDTDELIGESLIITVEHKEGAEGGVFANVTNTVALPKQKALVGEVVGEDPFVKE